MSHRMLRRPFVAIGTALTLVVVLAAVLAYPWSGITGVADHRDISAAGPDRNTVATVAPVRYVALGSSYAAGADSPDLIDTACLRAGDNYPHQIAQARHLSLTDVTCSGSTVADVLDRAQRGRASAPQIDSVTADVGLVTITTGGNDVGYIGRLTGISCANRIATATELNGRRCSAGHARRQPSPVDFAVLRANLIRLVDNVLGRAPHAAVVIVDYPPVLDAGATLCPAVPLTPEEAALTARTFDGLTAATREAAAATGAVLVDTASAGSAHTVCSASPWVYGYRLPAPYHPNDAGRHAMADMTLAAIDSAGLLQNR